MSNFQPLQVVARGSEAQLEVGENMKLFNLCCGSWYVVVCGSEAQLKVGENNELFIISG